MRKVYDRECSPEIVEELAENDVFVFSCGTDGKYLGNSRLHQTAKEFGDFEDGKVTSWITGCTYAIKSEVLSENQKERADCIEKQKASISDFISYAKDHPKKRFLVTPIATGGIFKFKTYHIAPMFEEALYVDNIILPQEFVDHLAIRAGKPIVNVLVVTSDKKFLDLCNIKEDVGLIRLVKTVSYGSEFEKTAQELSKKDNLWKSIDAVIFDPEVKESEDDDPYSGLDTVLTMEKVLNYNLDLPFYCLTTKDEKTVKDACGLSKKKTEKLPIYTMDKADSLKHVILTNDKGDGRLRCDHAELFKAADWFDKQKTGEGKETACEFISSVLRNNTDNIVNRARSFRDMIIDVLVENDVLPKIGENNTSYGTIVNFIRDGIYPKPDKTGMFYLLETGNSIPKGLRFMFEDIKENGNEASHTISLLDEYISLSVFYAFCSLLLWLYQNHEEIESRTMKCYGEQNRDAIDNWSPMEGVVEVVRINQQEYFYCGDVHLKDKNINGVSIENGRKVKIKEVTPERGPKLPGVTLFSKQWEYTDL